MAIQFKRGTDAQRKESTEKLLAGQPFYEADTSKLYVGDGSTELKALKPVNPLPTATKETLGGVKIGDNIDLDEEGTISVPTATKETLGLVKPTEVTDKPLEVKVTRTEDRYYGVQASADGSMFVNVPWGYSPEMVSWHQETCYKSQNQTEKKEVWVQADQIITNMVIPIEDRRPHLAVLVFDEYTANNITNNMESPERIAQSAPFGIINCRNDSTSGWEETTTYVPVYTKDSGGAWHTVGAWVICEDGQTASAYAPYKCLLLMDVALSAHKDRWIKTTVYYLSE